MTGTLNILFHFEKIVIFAWIKKTAKNMSTVDEINFVHYLRKNRASMFYLRRSSASEIYSNALKSFQTYEPIYMCKPKQARNFLNSSPTH